jgi:hypothetical protein
MIAFSRTLPQQFNQPLPTMMAQLTQTAAAHQRHHARANDKVSHSSYRSETANGLTSEEIRHLADAVAAWHLRSPLGICLRRSLLRYYFLRRANVPVVIVFGARLKSGPEGGGIGGHAWLTLDDQPYYELAKDYASFVPMYIYPENVERSTVKP